VRVEVPAIDPMWTLNSSLGLQSGEPIRRSLDVLQEIGGLWTSAEVRLCVHQSPIGAGTPTWSFVCQMGYAAIDGTSLRTTLPEPHCLEGQVTVDDLVLLLSDWKDGVPHRLAGINLRPPEITLGRLTSGAQLPGDVLNSLATVYPAQPDLRYRAVVVEGYGDEPQEQPWDLYAKAMQYGWESVSAFTGHYTGHEFRFRLGPWFSLLCPLPLSLRLQQTAPRLLRIEMFFRPSAAAPDGWLRARPGHYSDVLPSIEWSRCEDAPDGWRVASAQVAVDAEANEFTAWFGHDRAPVIWSKVRIAPDTAEAERAGILDLLYPDTDPSLSKVFLAKNRQLAFETLIRNLFVACGSSVLDLGVQSKRMGVDTIAFASKPPTAYAVSVTTGSDIRGKVTTLSDAVPDLQRRLANWSLQLVLVSGQEGSPSAADLEACDGRGVVLLTRSDIAALVANRELLSDQIAAKQLQMISRIGATGSFSHVGPMNP
jgi:hypothetical protein